MKTFKQYITEDLKSWFGNSKVVDNDNNPLPVYKALYQKDWRNGNDINSVNSPDNPWAGYFTNDYEVAKSFANTFKKYFPKLGSQIIEVYLKIENPFILNANGKYAKEFMLDRDIGYVNKKFPNTDLYKAIINPNFDGAIIYNTKDEADLYITKFPNQSKLITNTTWDVNDDRFSFK